MTKTKAEQQIERMWLLEFGEEHSCESILRCLYCKHGLSIRYIANYYVQSVGTIHKLLKKYNIQKEFTFV